MKTYFIDIMLDGQFLFTMRYRTYPPIQVKDVERKVIEAKPSLKGKRFEMYF